MLISVLVAFGLPTGHSTPFNLAWSRHYGDALSWTDPLPRYLPGLWEGFGGHDFFFYAPLPFWLNAALIDPLCPGCTAPTEFLLGLGLLTAASGGAMFAFLRCLVSPGAAAFGAAIYVVLPYHLLIDWFARQSAGEVTAYAFLPLVALGIERLRRHEGGGWILALGTAGLAFSHLPTTLLAAHPFAALGLWFVVRQPGGRAAKLWLLARLAWFGGLGLMLAAVYWLPSVLLLDKVSRSVLADPYFEAWRWLQFSPAPHPNPVLKTQLLASFYACLPFLILALRSARGPVLAWILVPAIFAIAMNTAPSAVLWNTWIIGIVQFPWRLMTLVDFAAALAAAVLAAGAVDRLGKLSLVMAVGVASVPAVFLAAALEDRPADAALIADAEASFGAIEYFSPEMSAVMARRLGTDGLQHFDQLAVAASAADMAAEFRDQYGDPKIVARTPRSLTVLAPEGAEVLALPVQFWGLWQAETALGADLSVRANPRFGTLDILGPTGGFAAGPVTVSLPVQPSEWAGALASLLALIALLASTAGRFRRR